jgi:MoaA/NifB/PqqE/SkfB family radical SAM enzyme
MINNRYTFLRRFLNSLHGVSPFFQFTKRFSRPLKIRRLKKRLAAFTLPSQPGENDPLFTTVEIETINRCNGGCGFCPVNRERDPRPLKKMSEELFRKIVDELAALHFTQPVSLYSNNEPFLDARIFDFAEYAKSKLPDARIVIFTNGTLLNVEKYERIMRHIDLLVIDNYCTDYKLRPNVEEIARYIEDKPNLAHRTEIKIRYENEILTTRGGQAPNANAKPKSPIPVGCLLPTRQMIIRPDGALSLCCNDALGTVTVGNVETDGLAGAWNSETARKIRREVLNSRTGFPICQACDTMY